MHPLARSSPGEIRVTREEGWLLGSSELSVSYRAGVARRWPRSTGSA